MTEKENSFDPEIIRQFHASEHWYRHGLVRTILFTDGTKYVADAAGAYWLLDEIALAQRYIESRRRRGISGVEADGQTRQRRHPRLRGWQ
jgi:hypothetical protein